MSLTKNSYSTINNLRYKKKDNLILDRLNFDIPLNKRTFILGNNGSGKSTLLDVITENIKSYEGTVHTKKIYKGKSGVLFDAIPFSPTLKVKELVKLFELIFNVSRVESTNFIIKLDLKKLFNKQFKVLSLGEKKRVGLFVALFHNPDLLILDEPFGGIDPNSLNIVSSLLFTKDRTTIVSSHNWKIAGEKADYVLFLHQGKQLFNALSSPNELLSDKYIPYSKKVVVDFEHKNLVNELFANKHLILKYDNYFHIFIRDDDEIKGSLEDNNIPYSIDNKNLNDIYNYLIIKNETY
jgi:ABC-2 type transport system ATP-binding protein